MSQKQITKNGFLMGSGGKGEQNPVVDSFIVFQLKMANN